jgi:alpha-1,2-glucosyltransferase
MQTFRNLMGWESPLACAVLLLVTNIWIGLRQPEPYMDELFHIPQAKNVCASVLAWRHVTYNQKITTPPGLYSWPALISVVVPSFCTTRGLRALSGTFVGFSLPILASIISNLRGRIPRNSAPCYRESEAKPGALALIVILNPPFFFLSNLFYTDPPALFATVLCWQLSLTGYSIASAIAGLYAASCRQTCAVFHAFIAFQDVVFGIRSRKPRRHIMTSSAPHSLAGLVYLYCLYQNSFRIALGDHGHHTASMHVAMFAYNGGYFLISSIPLLVVLGLRRRGMKLFVEIVRSRMWRVVYMLSVAFMMLLVYKTGSYTHPFVLADNRHFTFYIYRRILLRGAFTRSLLCTVYAAGLLIPFVSIQMCFNNITSNAEKRNRTQIEWVIEETFCEACLYIIIAICLVPATLLEPRYFVPGYFVMMLRFLARSRISKDQARLCVAALAAANTALVFIFCEIPFERPIDQHMPNDLSPGRFMF